jgi:hypothetical protein
VSNAEQIKRDHERYVTGMVNGEHAVCLAIERRYGLDGYPPQWVSEWMNAEMQKPGSGGAVIDKLICGE